jgi:hypothetical protein
MVRFSRAIGGIPLDRDYCPDCGLEITEDNPVAEGAIEEGDDYVCRECWQGRQDARVEACIRHREELAEGGR